MQKIEICVGSSCYLKGAQKIIDHLQKLIKENHLESKIELIGAFCLGDCGDGIAIRINEQIQHIKTAEEAEELININAGKES